VKKDPQWDLFSFLVFNIYYKIIRYNMKKVFSFTLDEEVIKELDDFCEDGLITKSKLVNKIIKDYIDKNKKKDDTNKNSEN